MCTVPDNSRFSLGEDGHELLRHRINDILDIYGGDDETP